MGIKVNQHVGSSGHEKKRERKVLTQIVVAITETPAHIYTLYLLALCVLFTCQCREREKEKEREEVNTLAQSALKREKT